MAVLWTDFAEIRVDISILSTDCQIDVPNSTRRIDEGSAYSRLYPISLHPNHKTSNVFHARRHWSVASIAFLYAQEGMTLICPRERPPPTHQHNCVSPLTITSGNADSSKKFSVPFWLPQAPRCHRCTDTIIPFPKFTHVNGLARV